MRNIYITILIIFSFTTCKKPFNPPPGKVNTDILIIDGTIGVGNQTKNIFTLSRLNTIANNQYRIPELNAQLNIVSEDGNKWPIVEVGNGYYQATTNLPENATYKLEIKTNDGSVYESAFEKALISPPIDSVTWKLDNDLNIYVHTRDRNNNTRFYRWDFIETYERHSWYESTLEFINDQIVTRKDQIYSCWTQDSSRSILIQNTNTLSEDAVSYQLLTTIKKPKDKLSVKYSILVKQFALTKEAYQFWDILKKNTELTGTLFDPQPSMLPSNIKCISNPTQKTVGYISVCKIQEKRIFIKNSELVFWPLVNEAENCPVISDVPSKVIEILKRDNSYMPAYFETLSGKLAIAKKYCVDCRIEKGSNIKPTFWE